MSNVIGKAKIVDFSPNIGAVATTQSDAANNNFIDESLIYKPSFNSDNLYYEEYDDGTILIWNGDPDNGGIALGWSTIDSLNEIITLDNRSFSKNDNGSVTINGVNFRAECVNLDKDGNEFILGAHEEIIIPDGENGYTTLNETEKANFINNNLNKENGYVDATGNFYFFTNNGEFKKTPMEECFDLSNSTIFGISKMGYPFIIDQNGKISASQNKLYTWDASLKKYILTDEGNKCFNYYLQNLPNDEYKKFFDNFINVTLRKLSEQKNLQSTSDTTNDSYEEHNANLSEPVDSSFSNKSNHLYENLQVGESVINNGVTITKLADDIAVFSGPKGIISLDIDGQTCFYDSSNTSPFYITTSDGYVAHYGINGSFSYLSGNDVLITVNGNGQLMNTSSVGQPVTIPPSATSLINNLNLPSNINNFINN